MTHQSEWFEQYQTTREPRDMDPHEAITKDVAFNRHEINEGTGHVSPFDNGTVCVGTDNIEVRLVQGVNEDDFLNVLSKATRATIGIEPDEDQVVDRESAEEMFKGGLQTALETAVVVFEVRGVSRTCTHQLVRTRKASFHQQSQRASYMGDMPEVRMPESVWRNPTARWAFMRAIHFAHEAYKTAAEHDISYQDARFILPEGTTTYILCEYPLREFINVYNYRGCSMFQWEIVKVMRLMREALVTAHPWLEPHIKISCERTPPPAPINEGVGQPLPVIGKDGKQAQHQCTFQGWEEVDEQCDFQWAVEEARTYRPSDNLRIAKGKS
jgi:thymidylate synthase (FAD)